MTGPVRTGSRLGFDTLLLDSPATRNALSVALLGDALAAVRASAAGDARGLLVEHTGPAFCAGVDLKERRRLGPADSSHSILLARLLRELWHHPRPVVVRVDGAVRGGGMGLLACADLVLATSRSTFAYSESRVGVAPALVMAVTLPLVSSRALSPHLLDGAVFDAATARDLGLVGQVVEADDRDTLDDVLDRLRQGAPGAQATIKRLVRRSAAPDIDALIDETTVTSAELFAGAEAAEGMAAFAERRPPAWAAVLDGAAR